MTERTVRPGLVFLSEPAPPRGVAVEVAPGIRRMVANNPGPMTYRGTNTYLVRTDDGTAVIDPGPEDDRAHIEAIVAACAGPVGLVLLTHTHRDHVGAAAALVAATRAKLAAFVPAAGAAPPIDLPLADGTIVAGLRALHTPGHAADHLCFARADGVLFSGDHVMSWSSSVVIPPEGDMTAYMAGLERLLARDDRLYLPGHGPPLAAPLPFVRALLDHRLARERAVLAAVGEGAADPAAVTDRVYGPIAAPLRDMARRNVLAHLLKLRDEGRVHEAAAGWRAA